MTDRSQFYDVRSMRKGEATRQRIVVRTADLLNTQGYRATPVSEWCGSPDCRRAGFIDTLKAVTSLTLEAFEFSVARVRSRFLQAIEGRETAKDSFSRCSMWLGTRCARRRSMEAVRS